MKIDAIPVGRLTSGHLQRWTEIQQANSDLQSPFFHPSYTCEAAAVFGNVEVAVLAEGGEPVGFFPFQRTAGNVGVPVGGSLNDFQGVVALPDFAFDAAALVRACRLSGLRFTQLLASQQPFQPHHWLTADSPSLDLREGFDAYCRQRREAGSTLISRTRDKRRFAIRDLGPLRFEDNAADPCVLERLIAWKSRQYERIRAVNAFTQPGTLDFLRRLLALRGTAPRLAAAGDGGELPGPRSGTAPRLAAAGDGGELPGPRSETEFRGVLSAMYFGDRLAAVHLGLRCGNVLHVWFPTYDEELGKYSPGNIYFVEQARAAAQLGIQRIDLGCGNEKFKASLRSFGTLVAEGGVGLGLLSTSARRTWLYTKQWVQSSRFHGAARAVVRGIRGLFLYGRPHDSKLRKSR